MNQVTKNMLDSFNDFAIEELDKELRELNVKIDKKILRGASYTKEAEEHIEVVKLRKQIMLGI